MFNEHTKTYRTLYLKKAKRNETIALWSAVIIINTVLFLTGYVWAVTGN